jgi:hypothetical protein
VIPAVPDAGLGKVVIIALIALACVSVVMLYDRPGLGVRVFETLLKVMVGVIVLCFVGAVVMLAVYGQLDGGQVIGGFLPSFSSFTSPATTYEPFLAEVAAEHRGFWEGIIVGAQQDKIIAAAAVAVGVNMTFLLPYSMLRKGWGKNFRGLATFDMSTGLLIPFIIATSCIVIAATAQFHTHPAPGLMGELDEQGQVVQPSPGELADYTRKVDARLQDELGAEAWSAMSEAEQQAARAALPEAERLMAAMLVERKFGDLSRSLAPFTGDRPAELIFGLGVLAMAISTAIILMLINGLAFCVAFNRPYTSWTHRIGAIIPAITGAFGPFYWGQLTAATDVATITAAVGMILLPVAYITFILLINNRKVMGEDKPAGGKAALLNAVLIFTVTLVSIGAVRELWKKLEWGGIALMIGFLLVAALWPVVFGRKERPEGEKLAVE